MTDQPPHIPGMRHKRFLAPGGCADVHLYTEFKHDRDIAVKVLRTVLGPDTEARFHVEAKAMKTLGNHPNIVQVFDVGVHDGRMCLLMQYYPKPNLEELLAAKGRLGIEEALRLGVKIAAAIETTHRAGLLHRDIKPANILTDEYGEPGLTDFGIAGTIADPGTEDIMLSLPWSPPEMVDVSVGNPSSVASDVYSLGATIWHMLNGHYPFWNAADPSKEGLEDRIQRMPPTRPGADVPREVDDLLVACLAKRVADRPVSAHQVAKALRDAELRLGLSPTSITLRDEDEEVTVRPEVLEPTGPRRRRDPTTESEHTAVRLREPQVYTRTHTSVRERVVDRTKVRSPQGRPEPVAPLAKSKRRWLPWALATAGVAVVGFLAFALVSAPDEVGKPDVSRPAPPSQQAVAGGDVPPGPPTITAARVDTGKVKFTWTYSAQLANDSYSWQLADGSGHGIADAPELELQVPTGKTVCVQLKVVRADGSNAMTRWSEKGCSA
jgi:serine/threonine protein kinase